KLSFYIVIRPYDFEGISPIQHIQYLQSQAFLINHDLGIILDKKPDNVVCMSHKEGDVSEHFNKVEMIFNTTCNYHMASAFAEYKVVIEPQKSVNFSIKCPTKTQYLKSFLFQKHISKDRLESLIHDLKRFSYKSELKQNIFEYKKHLKQLNSFNVPHDFLTQFITAQQTYMISSIGKNHFIKGVYHRFLHSYLDDIVLFKALCQLGYKPALCEHFFDYHYFQKLYSVLKKNPIHYSLLGTWFTYLKELYNFGCLSLNEDSHAILSKIIHLAIKKCVYNTELSVKTCPQRVCSRSGIQSYFLADNLGLLEILNHYEYLSRQLNLPCKIDISFYKNQSEQAVDDFIESVCIKTALKDVVPVNMIQYISLDSIVTLLKYSECFPSNKKLYKNTLQLIQQHLLRNNYIYSFVNPTGYPLKENILYAQLLLQSDPQAAFKSIENILSFSSPSFCFPDAVNPITLGGSDGDGHNIKHAARFIDTFLKCIVLDKGAHVELFKGIPHTWVDSHSFSLSNILSVFGTFSVSVLQESTTCTQVSIEFTKNRPCDYILMYIPLSFSSVSINNKEMNLNHNQLKLPAQSITFSLIKHDT
ncbi:hypothetical protein DID78_07200, partial [Candidatus Marinamargulisbacteria bacterium SCGC AG-343-D04]